MFFWLILGCYICLAGFLIFLENVLSLILVFVYLLLCNNSSSVTQVCSSLIIFVWINFQFENFKGFVLLLFVSSFLWHAEFGLIWFDFGVAEFLISVVCDRCRLLPLTLQTKILSPLLRRIQLVAMVGTVSYLGVVLWRKCTVHLIRKKE